MIFLDDTTSSLEVDLTGAVATNQLPFVASYVDINTSTFNMTGAAANTGTSNNTTAVTLVAAPGATTTRQLKFLSLKNSDTAAVALWVQLNENATLREIWKGTLAVGDTLFYVDGAGWNVINTNGQIKSGSGISSGLTSTDNAVVRWDGTGGTTLQNSGVIVDDSNNVTGVVALTFTGTLTASGSAANIALGSNFISNGGTDAGLSFDASNNATLSANVTVVGAGGVRSGPLQGTSLPADLTAYDGAYVGFSTNAIFGAMASGANNRGTIIRTLSAGVAVDAITISFAGNTTLSGNLTVSGATSAIGNTISSTTNLILSAGTTGVSSLRVPHGSAPTSPVDGDVWTTTAGLFVRINGASVGPLS